MSVFALALCATALAWSLDRTTAQRAAEQRFESEVAAAQVALADRLDMYEQVLRGAVSLFHSWPTVTRDNWRLYVAHLEIAENYPGIQGVGFAPVVSLAEKQSHVLSVRAEGFPDYRILPDGEREVYTPIVYLEPFDWRNQRAFGFDMFQEPVRRAATASPPDRADRRRDIVGYVYSPFRMDDFIGGIRGDGRRHFTLQIFDGGTASDEALMYTTGSPDEFGATDTPPFVETVPIELNGRTWTLRFAALPALRPDGSTALIVAVAGLVISLLLWAIVWSLARNRAQVAAANEQLKSDIAQRERVEASLGATEEGFRYLFEKNPNPMWVFDRETLEILEVNDAAVAQYGWSHDEFRQMRITDLRHEEDIPRLRSYLRDRPLGLKAAGVWRHLTKDGRTIDVEIVSYTLQFHRRPTVLVVARDVTESRRAEAALRESEEVARGVLDSALDAYVRMDEQRRVTEWNRAAEMTFGWTRDEAVGKLLEELLIPPEQREAHRRGVARYLDTGEGPLLDRRIEVEALHKSGRVFPVELTIQVVETDSRKLFSAFLRDLTEKKAAEAQLHQAQKMEAVGQLTGGIAHDFNNLLTVIIGNLELAGSSGSDSASVSESIGQALAAAEKGAALTHRLLAFSRQQSLHPVRTDLNAVIRGMIELLRRTLGEDIEMEVRLAQDLWPELADRSQVENALLNLAINARDAMPHGGRLTIETGNVSLGAEYAEQNEEVEPGDYVMLAVTDTGTGMAPEVVERAFDPFFTTKDVGTGSGLGLSMTYGFAQQSGGHLKIFSEVGRGTTVRLYLPRAAEAQPDSSIVGAPGEDSRGSETILVVEDEDAVRKLVVRNLESLGYQILEAADAPQAAEILEGDERIDLLFTDIVLPGGKTGWQLANEAQALRPDMRVLFTSGYTQDSIAYQGKLDAGVHLLSKPYRREDLGRKVREVLSTERNT